MNIKLVKKLCLVVLTILSIASTTDLSAGYYRDRYYGGYRGGWGWGGGYGYRGWGPGIGFSVGIGGSPYWGGYPYSYYPAYPAPVVASPARISRATEDYEDKLADQKEEIKDIKAENRTLRERLNQLENRTNK